MRIGTAINLMLVAESNNDEKRYDDIIKRHNNLTLAEIKYDGYRIQVHKKNKIWIYTRNLNELDPKLFPELSKDFTKLPDGIYDGELVGYGDAIHGFNAVKKRIRDEVDKKYVTQYPIQIRYFDIMQQEQKELIDLPLYERRIILSKLTENISLQEQISDIKRLKEKFQEAAKQDLEGLVCKNPDSKYLIGKRTKEWIKVKNFNALDFVILGVYAGEGKAATLPFAGLLLGTKNGDNYETICKIGISDKKMIEQIYTKLAPAFTEYVPTNLMLSPALTKKSYSRKIPIRYVFPERSMIVETEFLNITNSKNWHSCGLENEHAYSLRIAKINQLREDKSLTDCVTTQDIKSLFTN